MFAAKAPKGGNPNGKGEALQHATRTDRGTDPSFLALPSSSMLSLTRDNTGLSDGSDSGSAWPLFRGDVKAEGDSGDNDKRSTAGLGGNGMIDEDSIYSKNKHTLVAYFGPLPKEVDEALSKAGTDLLSETLRPHLACKNLIASKLTRTRYHMFVSSPFLISLDYYTEPMIAKLDLDAGLGIVVSQTKCYIWAAQKVTVSFLEAATSEFGPLWATVSNNNA